jgi:hypothetical protein
MAEYEVVDLTSPQADLLEATAVVDPSDLAKQLKDISDAVAPVLAESDAKQPFGLDSIELTLTIGGEGRVLFVAKGSVEASIKATFQRPSAE